MRSSEKGLVVSAAESSIDTTANRFSGRLDSTKKRIIILAVSGTIIFCTLAGGLALYTRNILYTNTGVDPGQTSSETTSRKQPNYSDLKIVDARINGLCPNNLPSTIRPIIPDQSTSPKFYIVRTTPDGKIDFTKHGQPPMHHHLTVIISIIALFSILLTAFAIGTIVLVEKIVYGEKELYTRDEYLKITLNNSGIYLWDWKVTERKERYSRIFCEVVGLSSHQLHLHTQLDCEQVHPDDIKKRADALQNYFKNKTTSYKCAYRIRVADGTWHWIEDAGKATEYDNNGQPTRMLGTLRDIHNERQFSIFLTESEHRYRLLVENTVDVIWIMDTNYILTYVSPSVKDMLDYTPDEIIGKPVKSFMSDDTFATIKQSFLQRAKSDPYYTQNPAVTLEIRLNARNGKMVIAESRGRLLIDDKGCITGVQGILRNLTEIKHNEAQRKMLQLAIEQSSETIIITDTDAIMQYVNPAFLKISGYTEDEIIGQNPRILHSGKHDAAFYREIWDTLLRGETWVGRITNKNKNGSFFTEDTTISPVFDSDGKTINYVSVRRDVTQEIELEKQLQQAQKMEAVGLLAGGIAHDFNNMLQAIDGYSEIARDDLTPQHPAYQAIGHILESSERAARLVKQILAFSRRQVLDIQPIDLNRTISKLMKSLLPTIGAHIKISYIPEQNLRKINADFVQMEQIIMNLCLNARDAMPNGGTLTIETKNISLSDRYCKSQGWEVAPGEYVLLCISDTGEGMKKEIIEHIFDPFFTTKEVGSGTGLGLSTVYGLVKQHAGMINVYSEINIGTVFKIYLPVPKSEATQKEQISNQTIEGGTETILMAEDDDGVFNIATTLLEMAGYTVLGAHDGVEAIELFDKHADNIDMALLDVMMPRMDGKGVFEHIRKTHPHFPILFASGYSINAIHNHFVLEEGTELLQKPYQRDQLLFRIREILDRAKQTDIS